MVLWAYFTRSPLCSSAEFKSKHLRETLDTLATDQSSGTTTAAGSLDAGLRLYDSTEPDTAAAAAPVTPLLGMGAVTGGAGTASVPGGPERSQPASTTQIVFSPPTLVTPGAVLMPARRPDAPAPAPAAGFLQGISRGLQLPRPCACRSLPLLFCIALFTIGAAFPSLHLWNVSMLLDLVIDGIVSMIVQILTCVSLQWVDELVSCRRRLTSLWRPCWSTRSSRPPLPVLRWPARQMATRT